MEEAAYLHLVDDRLRATAAGMAAALGASPEDLGLHRGKRLRSRLVHACAEALGSDAEASAPWAALVELIHMASLVHDDVIDGATLRRGRASIAARDGNRSAILAGDLLVSSAWLAASRELSREMTGLLASAMIDMTMAELRERDLLWNASATLSSYLAVIDGKTAALFTAALEGTAVLAGAPPATRAALVGFGRSLGRSFQILDDARDFQVEREVSGKERMKDLQEGIVTLPLIIGLRHGGMYAPTIRDYLASRGEVPLDPAAAIGLLDDSAALVRSQRLARRGLDSGLRVLAAALPAAGLRRLALSSLGWAETPRVGGALGADECPSISFSRRGRRWLARSPGPGALRGPAAPASGASASCPRCRPAERS